MKVEYFQISQIQFTYTAYSKALYDSLKRVGLNFPIRVYEHENTYVCRDGNKRLSALQDLCKNAPEDNKFQRISVIVEQRARTAAPYHLHNHH